jgi:hypothetical protein
MVFDTFDESSTRKSNTTSTVFEKCIIKLALADAGGKFRRQGGGLMCEAISTNQPLCVRVHRISVCEPWWIKKDRLCIRQYYLHLITLQLLPFQMIQSFVASVFLVHSVRSKF